MLPNTFKKLVETLANGAPLDVECLDRCDDLEAYPERGMRLTIVGVTPHHDDVTVLRVSYEKYDQFNTAFESSNYYDKQGVPQLTARQAGMYKVNDTLYVGTDEDPNKYFKQIESNRWLDMYLKEYNANPGETYVAFLERLATKWVP